MKTPINIENLFQKRKLVFLFLFLLLSVQLIYSFAFPSANSNSYWRTMEELNFFKGHSFDSFDNSILSKIYPLIANYRLNLDGGGQILLAHDFPQHYFRGHVVFLNRPLYAFLIFLISQPLHLISNSYSLTFVAGILLNFILFLAAAFIFYLLLQKLISSRAAFLSSFLLILSPFAHIWLVQPETNVFGAFTVILSLYLFYNYITNPSFKKIIIFSLIIGILMLGKMLFAISFFILLSALYFKRYKEGILFLIIHLIPLVLWYLWVTRVWGMSYFSAEITDFNMGIWLINIFHWPWYQTAKIFLNALPLFILSVIYGFLLVPVIFALVGFKEFLLKNKTFFSLNLTFSFFLLFFLMNFYSPRQGFLLFPIIYPLAVLGIDKSADSFKKYINPKVFYLVVYIFLIVISSINVFKIFPYDVNCCPWLI